MFQCAAGIAFSKAFETSVVFHTTPKTSNRLAEFRVSRQYTVQKSSRLDPFMSSFFGSIRNSTTEELLMNAYREIGNNFQALPYQAGKKYFGYFQSWRYFDTLKSDLNEAFQLEQPSGEFEELLKTLPHEFTGIHIRRGGGGKAVLNADFHGLLGLEYYRQAIGVNKQLGGSQKYVVFTDNPSMAREVIEGLHLGEYIVIGPETAYSQCENLHLMSRATSFIGANSSYSWWATYLNSKLVTPPIFPRQWYMDPDISTTDMLLPQWISLGFSKFANEPTFRGIAVE